MTEQQRYYATHSPFSRPPASMNGVVLALGLAALWSLLALCWLMFGFNGDDDFDYDARRDHDPAAIVRSVRPV